MIPFLYYLVTLILCDWLVSYCSIIFSSSIWRLNIHIYCIQARQKLYPCLTHDLPMPYQGPIQALPYLTKLNLCLTSYWAQSKPNRSLTLATYGTCPFLANKWVSQVYLCLISYWAQSKPNRSLTLATHGTCPFLANKWVSKVYLISSIGAHSWIFSQSIFFSIT